MGLKKRIQTKPIIRPSGDGLLFGKKFKCNENEDTIIYQFIAETDKLVLVSWTNRKGKQLEVSYSLEDSLKYINQNSWILID